MSVKCTILCHHFSENGCLLRITACDNCKEFTLAGVFQMRAKDVPALRKSILELQGGSCFICGVTVLDESAWCLDHHHQKKVKGSGKVRGVLCRGCNVFLAKIENNAVRCGISQDRIPAILRGALRYFEAEQYPYLHPSEKAKEPKLKKSSFNKLLKDMKTKGCLKFPTYPKSGKVTAPLQKLFNQFNVEPEFYSK